MQDADAVATEQTVEFVKEEGPGLVADGLTVGAAAYACYQSIGVLCSASASWAAASIDSRFNNKNHLFVDVMVETGINDSDAHTINNIIGLGLSAPGAMRVGLGGALKKDTPDVIGVGVWGYERYIRNDN